MRNKNIITVNVPSDKIIIDRLEAALRLKIPPEYTDENIAGCEKKLRQVLACRYAYVKVPVTLKDGKICDIGFGKIESRDLSKALSGCSSAYILGVTTGIGVDRLISRLSVISKAQCFITDALASAAAESLCEYADNELRGTGKKPLRFSPGYGDLPLSVQPDVLGMLGASETLGITLNSSLLMTPVKSVTAVMGIPD